MCPPHLLYEKSLPRPYSDISQALKLFFYELSFGNDWFRDETTPRLWSFNFTIEFVDIMGKVWILGMKRFCKILTFWINFVSVFVYCTGEGIQV